jgi:polyribonucleotide nucleotidyltransferase
VTQLGILMDEIDKELIRYFVVKDKKRIDGRDFETIRNLDAIVNYIPRVHGTGLFTRGLTQSLTFCTLASGQYKQIGQGMEGDTEKRYIHNYNFPPYSTGETGNVGGANRRAIGHGVLAEKALLAVLPKEEDFPYTIRVVSEILSSNGSTSMAAACGSSLALMDAGVPISSHVGGIGIGLFVDKSIENPSLGDFIVLTDIIGEEDFAGYMDFKLTGTRAGMTAIQLELKLQGIPLDLLDVIFERSFIARQKVLDVMDSAISAPRTEVSQYAPKIKVVFIDPDKVGMVIGSGGSMIKDIVETTGAELDITEMEGKAMVSISAIDPKAIAAAEEWVLSIVQDIKVGDIFEGEVNRIEAYGAFVKLNHTKDGLLHVSELANTFVKDVNDYVKMGDRFKVKVIGVENGKVSVSKKALEQSQEFHR